MAEKIDTRTGFVWDSDTGRWKNLAGQPPPGMESINMRQMPSGEGSGLVPDEGEDMSYRYPDVEVSYDDDEPHRRRIGRTIGIAAAVTSLAAVGIFIGSTDDSPKPDSGSVATEAGGSNLGTFSVETTENGVRIIIDEQGIVPLGELSARSGIAPEVIERALVNRSGPQNEETTLCTTSTDQEGSTFVNCPSGTVLSFPAS